jgi:hypothetical protein
VRAAARVHRHDATPETHDEALQRAPPHPTPQNNPAQSVQTGQAATVLATIDPNDNEVHRLVPLSQPDRDPNGSRREERAIP